ncbi:MAG: CPBP family intramembrane glutamic endopeptidase [Thermoanaerobaculia bacterium]
MINTQLRAPLRSIAEQVCRYRTTTVGLGIMTCTILVLAAKTARLGHATAYLAAMLLGALIVDAVARTEVLSEWIVRDPVRESRIVAFALLVTAGLSVLRFVLPVEVQHLPPVIRGGLGVLVLLFVYPGFLSYYFFVSCRYRPRDLGLDWHRAWVALPIIAVIGVVGSAAVPEKQQFRTMFEQMGLLGMLLLGFGTAAIPEEFVRGLSQSRFAALLGDKGLGWLTGSMLWALLHIPIFYRDSGSFAASLRSAIGILPLGLLWGYMSARLRSILPSIFVHGTNLWGLQDVL